MDGFIIIILLIAAGYWYYQQNANKSRGNYKTGRVTRPYSQGVNEHGNKNENDQLQMVMQGGYRTKAILNKSEMLVFNIINKMIRESDIKLSCFPQVSCGEIFTHDDVTTYLATVNSKRVDFCLCDARFIPKAIIEYQGTGHESETSGVRDAIKSQASISAGIKYVQIFHGDNYKEKLAHELDSILCIGSD